MVSSTKDRVLMRLKEAQGDWVSGQVLSDGLKISRTAVWKQVRTLREEGYVIASSSRKGYLLQASPERLLPAEIRAGLKTSGFGRGEIAYFESVSSTNTLAKEMAAKGVEEGTLVVAESQDQGRGRRGRWWYSPPHTGIYASLLLRPPISPAEAPQINIVAAVAAAEGVMGLTGLDVKVKWPNDIMFAGKKLAGILTEISADLDGVDYLVVGWGINVTTSPFPPELAGTAVSILEASGRTIPRVRLLQDILGCFERLYGRFCRDGLTDILQAYRKLSGVIGREVTVDMVNRRCSGRVVDVDDQGRLVLDEPGRGIRRIFSGDVTMLR